MEISKHVACRILDELELRIHGSFTDVDGTMWFNTEGPRIEMTYGDGEDEIILIKSTKPDRHQTEFETKYYLI